MFGFSSRNLLQKLSQAWVYLLAYFLVVPLPGAFRAWVSKKMGDSTAAEQGLMQIDPFVHVDIVGLGCMLLFGFGWGKRIPLDPSRIYGKHRFLKICIAAFSSAFMFIVQAILLLLTALLLFDSKVQVFSGGTTPSSFSLVIQSILGHALGLCVFLAVIEIVVNLVYLVIMVLLEKDRINPEQLWYTSLIATFALLFFFGEALQLYVSALVQAVAVLFSHVVGIM